jgi:hypothetical protein
MTQKMNDLVKALVKLHGPRLLVSIKEHHISSGLKGSIYHCPVANGFCEIDGFATANVAGSWVRADCGARFRLPEEVQEKIKTFDNYGRLDPGPMEPFNFEIDLTKPMPPEEHLQ